MSLSYMEFYTWYETSSRSSKFIVFNCSIIKNELCGISFMKDGHLFCQDSMMTVFQFEKLKELDDIHNEISCPSFNEKELLEIMRFIFEDIGDYYA